ncbi:aminopeptidase P family protein [SAR202 cluster bacterium AD-804-J14_MRT_500m]|nr:aminopeptidase P family protein [SAR202 cluster bacterium AD-804-J14_MRT_500m]
MNKRIERLRTRMKDRDLEAFIISTPENRRYLSGFTGSAGYLLITQSEALLATDFRYTEQAGGQSPDYEIIKVGRSWEWLAEQLSEHRINRAGFESTNLTVSSYQHMTETVKKISPNDQITLLATAGLVEGLRSIKDADELTKLQMAIDISDKAIETVGPNIQPGETEREIAWRLEKVMREFGADSLSFDTIVAAGSNGAMPHHRPTDRPVQPGEPIVIDMGAQLEGYCSDITRTVCVGQPDDKFQQVYDMVLTAQLTAIETLKPNMTGDQGDGLARAVLQEAGYAEQFGHSLGHGIGLEVHEYPGVGPGSTNVLEEGMVFSVEPGIYITGWGGVRIEDLVVLQSDGAKPLSRARK